MLYFLFSILQIAVYGKNFCTSAKRAFFLILRNVVRLLFYVYIRVY